MIITSSGIPIRQIDQVANSMDAVAPDMGWYALRCGHDLAADQNNTIVDAAIHLLNNHVVGNLGGDFECLSHIIRMCEVQRYASSLITVQRFQHDGRLEVCETGNRVLGGLNNEATGNGQSGIAEYLFCNDRPQYSLSAEFSGRKIGVVVLGKGRWNMIKPHISEIVAARLKQQIDAVIEAIRPSGSLLFLMAENLPHHTPSANPMQTLDWQGELPERMRAAFPSVELRFKSYLGQNFIEVPVSAVLDILRDLRDREQFDMLTDLTAVDHPKDPERFEIVYILYSFARNEYLRVKTRTTGEVPSVVDVFVGANWLEREVFDMFGIRFSGHPNLKRILLPEEWQGHPLLKETSITAMDNEWVQKNLGIESGQS